MRKWSQIIVSFVGALVALWLAHVINIFDYITFIPKDKSYDVCITVYFTLVESFVNIIYNNFTEWFDKQKVEIEAILFKTNEEPNRIACPILRFDDMGIAEMNMKVYVKGKSIKLKNKTITLDSMRQVQYQVGRRCSGAKVDNEGNYIVEIDKLCGNQEMINLEEVFKIVLQRGDMEDSVRIMISPKLNDNKCKLISFVTNEAKITLEEK